VSDDERVVGKFKTKKKHRFAALVTLFFMTMAMLVMLWQLVASKL
jgi:hypothetical protein